MVRSARTRTDAVPVTRVHRVRNYLLLSGLSALLLGLCYPQPGWGGLGYIALVPVSLLALLAERAGRLAWTSYVVSLLWWLVMLRWLLPVTGGGYAVLAAFLGLYAPATLLTLRVLVRRWGLPSVLALPMAWVTFELIRGMWPAGGFGWFGLGHCQAPFDSAHGVRPIIQIADLVGDHGVSFVLAMTNGVIVDMLTISWFRPSRAGRRVNRALVGGLGLWAMVMAAGIVYGLVRMNQGGQSPETWVAIVQTNVPQSNKRSNSREQIEQNWHDLVELTRAAGRQNPKPDLIVWPETAVPPINEEAIRRFEQSSDMWRQAAGQTMGAEEIESYRQLAGTLGITSQQVPVYLAGLNRTWAAYRQRIVDLGAELGTSLIIGSSAVYEGGAPRRYNCAYLYTAGRSDLSQRYDKVHRVPFGEYVPWVESWPRLKRMFIKYLTPYEHDYSLTPGGHAQPPMELDGSAGRRVRIVTPICFEDTVPRVCRRMIYDRHGRKRADLLINLTNDAWYGGPQRPQHMQIAVFRSIENRVPTARSVNTGVSGFISASGQIVRSQPEHTAGHAIYQVHLDPRSTLYGRLGQTPMIVLSILTAVLTLIGLFGRK